MTSVQALTVLSAVGMRQVMLALAPVFDHQTGHQLTVTFDSGAVIARRIRSGEAADIVIVPRPVVEELTRGGSVDRASVVDVAISTVGIAVRRDAQKPDVSSPDAVRRALLGARSIARPDPSLGGSSGIHIAQVMDRLGITAELRSKTILARPSG